MGIFPITFFKGPHEANWRYRLIKELAPKNYGTMSVSQQMRTYLSPNPTWILTCDQEFTFVDSGEG